jgi:hypothetical protein
MSDGNFSTPKKRTGAGSTLYSTNPEVVKLASARRVRALKDQLTSTSVKLTRIRGILNRPPIATGWGPRYVIPWLPVGQQVVNKAAAEEIRANLVKDERRLRTEVREAEDAYKSSYPSSGGKDGSGKGGSGKGSGEAKPKSQYSDTIIYNVSAVKEAYFSAGQSLFNKTNNIWGENGGDKFDNDLYSKNTPTKVADALELWTKGQGGKGMIQTWKPPGKTPAQYLDQNGNFSVLSDAKTLQRYGFQFLYNPGNISMTYGGVPDVDPSMMSSGTEDYGLINPSVFQSSISFEILLNRMLDIKYINKDGSLNSGKTVDNLWPQNKPNADTLKRIRNRGTMYDVEFLLQTMFSYEPIRSQLRGKTSDIGFLGAFPVELHLGNKLRYVAIIDNITVNHVIFTEDMVPMFTTVSISAKRVPDYRGSKTKNGA